MPPSLQLNPALATAQLASEFQAHGRLQVPDFLAATTADYLYQLLLDHQHWNLTYNEAGEHFESPVAAFDALQPMQKQQFMSAIYRRARDQFQYVFKQYYITQALQLGEEPGHPMHPLQAFMNSEAVLAFMRTLTGQSDIRSADTYASRYEAGHFLTRHDDRHDKHDRVAAYVISMTPDWNPDWGGYLSFFDAAGNVQEAYRPSFNTLNIFLVPAPHAVQLVAPFAGHARTSYLGWLHR
ncbi:MAG: 2OG-Fe(II) oxygenase family protein [Chromatocurvus sp.]